MVERPRRGYARMALHEVAAGDPGVKARRERDMRFYLELLTLEEPQIDRLIVWPMEDALEVYIEAENKPELCVVLDFRQARMLANFLDGVLEEEDRDG